MRVAARFGLWWLAFLSLVACLSVPAVAQSFPKFTGFVVDTANVLPADQEAALSKRLDDLQRRTGHQLVVATIPNLGGHTVEDYGYRLLRTWGVGLKGADNGAILIVAPTERKVRIEVGYGLEPWLTDAFSSVIINRTILPRFKAGDMPGGIVAGANAVADQLALPETDARGKVAAAAAEYDRTHRRASSNGQGGIPVGLIFLVIVIGFFVLPFFTRRRNRAAPWGRGYQRGGGGGTLPIVLWSIANGLGNSARSSGGWGGGGFGSGSSDGGGGWMGGGFGGGGGGSGGGGGASGSW